MNNNNDNNKYIQIMTSPPVNDQYDRASDQ